VKPICGIFACIICSPGSLNGYRATLKWHIFQNEIFVDKLNKNAENLMNYEDRYSSYFNLSAF
jgi:hypothetical protein